MKSLLSLFFMVATAQQAMAFDHLVGSYQVIGTPTIVKQNAENCDRFAFENIQSIEIEPSFGPKNQSHEITFNTSLNNSPTSFKHPILEYRDQTAEGFVSYATTTQAPDSIQNEWGNTSPDGINNGLIVGFVRLSETQYVAYIHEFRSLNGNVEAGCYYNVDIEEQ